MSSLVKAKDVLRLMSRMRRDLTVMDIANGLGLPKSSVSRTLSLMAEQEFLERDPVTRAYRPGALVMEASYHFRAARSARMLLEEELGKLVDEIGYTGYVVMLDGSESLVIHMRTGRAGTLQAYTPVGTRAPAYATSMGRAQLSHLTDAEALDRVGTTFEPIGEAPRDQAELCGQLADIRVRGWAFSHDEFVLDVAGTASAVRDPGTGQILGIGLAFPARDRNDALVARCGAAVRDAASRVGRHIGDPSWLAFEAPAAE
ncbi:IclR family transcriptional regulator [Streptomyces sp. NPDC059166]|uniref:IclR family transcriptional regulator n=1 Tax=Streptomyces sp. NPDC059166 TaxID=3346752 RepID=UPI0036874178